MTGQAQPTYGQLHRATAAICRELRENPLAMLGGEPSTARAYLAEVLTRAFPTVCLRQVLRWCGARHIEREAELVGTHMSGDAWRPEVVAAGLRAIGRDELILPDEDPLPPWWEQAAREPAPVPACDTPAAPPPRRTWQPPPVGSSPYRRVIVHRPAPTAAVPLGEPAPGRSALDERRAAALSQAALPARRLSIAITQDRLHHG